MIRIIVSALLSLFASFAFAAPFCKMELPTAQDATHCKMAFCNGAGGACAAYGADVAVTGSPKVCQVDCASAAVGPQSFRMIAVVVDPIWGRLESPPSTHFPFTRPAVPGAPSGGSLVP